MKKIAQILLPLAFDQSFSYFIPDNLEIDIGNLVLVNFRNKEIYGLVTEITADQEQHSFKIKEIIKKEEDVKINSDLIQLINFAASYNLGAKGLFLKLAISTLNGSNIKVKKARKQNNFDNINIDNFHLKNLSPSQQKAANFLQEELVKNQHNVTLIDGITGSGKTEIYFHALAKILRQESGQILILLPEIVLAEALAKRFSEQFGFEAPIWHSKISNSKKRDIFYAINNGKIRILIGTRSALFLPFSDLKLIIIDEEHESSFKQEDIVNYHGRDMAILRGSIAKIPVFLSSATPSIETFVNIQSHKYQHLKLDNRFFHSHQSDVKIIDMKREKLDSSHFISPSLKEAISICLSENKQSLLFLNRRGYAPLTLCRSCGFKISCKNCSSYMSFHQAKKTILICHHCGYQENPNKNCSNCNDHNFVTLGAGVERIEQEIKEYFPQARTVILTSDTIENHQEAREIFEKITNNEIDIIIGTQIIAKGHHFPHLELVGIIDADGSFNNGDLRACEKSFQLLTQVIGRAGREKYQAKIFLQSYNSSNLVFQFVAKNNRDDFFKMEIEGRKLAQMPPFSKMIAIIFIAKNEELAIKNAKNILRQFPSQDNIEIFGPAPMPISKIRQHYYYRLLVKGSKNLNLQKLVRDIVDNAKIDSQVRVKIDVDPL